MAKEELSIEQDELKIDKWNVVQFKDVVHNYDSKRIPIKASERKKSKGGKYPYYGASGIIDYVDDFIFEGEHLLISEDGANLLARVYPIAFKADGKFWVNNHAHIVKAKEGKTTNDYLEYYFSSIDISEYVTGSAQPKLNQRNLNSIKIPLPPLSEQRRIVSKLDALFAEIDASLALIDQNIAQAEALKLSVLDEEFGGIDPKFKKPLNKIMRVINGRAYKRKEMLTEGKYPILRVGNFFTNREWYYSDMELDIDKYCEAGDLLYAWSASFGPKIWDGEKSIYHYHIWKLEPLEEDKISRDFMYYQLEYDTEAMKAEGGRGVGMIHLTKGGIEKRKFAKPPIEVQNKIVEKIESFYFHQNKLVSDYTIKRENLEALKSSLLDQAFKGEL